MMTPPKPAVCTENSIRVDHVSKSPNVGDNDRAICPCLALLRLAVQVEEPTSGAERCAPTSARHIAAEGARHVRLADGDVRSSSSCIDGFRQSSRPLQSFAPRPLCVGIARLPPVLALEMTLPGRSAANRRATCVRLIRRMSVDNPLWGAPRIHGELLKLGFEVASPASPSIWSSDGTSLAWVAHLPAQPCTRHRRHGPVHCPNHWLRPALCPCHRSIGAPRACLDQRHTPTDCGIDCTPDHRGIPLG